MTLTAFGIVLAAVGFILLLRGSIASMLWMTMICALFGGSAAILLPGLGGASVPPAPFALVFLVARILLPGSGQYAAVGDALRANALFGAFTAYGIATALIASRLFAGQLQVVSLRATVSPSLFATTPLAFSPQNITTMIYIAGTFLVGVCAYVALRDRQSAVKFVKVAVAVTWLHIFLGVSAAILKGTPYDLFIDFFRNGNYAQNDQSIQGIVRMNGVMPEASTYAAFGFDWFVLMLECWFRNILPRRTGPAAAAMALVLFCTTSTTAYGTLAIYFVILTLRVMILPQSVPASKGLALFFAALAVTVCAAAAALLFPTIAAMIWDLLKMMTVEKQGTVSGLQRGFWARIGIDAFVASWGIGVGPGSFRSSTIITALLGSVGVIGTVLFLLHVVRVVKPMRISTYFGDPSRQGVAIDRAGLVGAATSWAALGVLIQTSLIAPTCDPGIDFGIFAGAALALRRAQRAPLAERGGADAYLPIDRMPTNEA